MHVPFEQTKPASQVTVEHGFATHEPPTQTWSAAHVIDAHGSGAMQPR
jgi:hypothetical protein